MVADHVYRRLLRDLIQSVLTDKKITDADKIDRLAQVKFLHAIHLGNAKVFTEIENEVRHEFGMTRN